jgi:hypothetical protein
MQHHSDPPEPFPHNKEPRPRKLGLSTVMRKGVPTLENSHKMCEQGKVFTAEQAQLFKLIGENMVVALSRVQCGSPSATMSLGHWGFNIRITSTRRLVIDYLQHTRSSMMPPLRCQKHVGVKTRTEICWYDECWPFE